MVARTIVVQGNLPALLKDPFFFKTVGVQKRREGAGAPVGFFGDTGSEKRTQQVGLFPRVCKSKPLLRRRTEPLKDYLVEVEQLVVNT